MSNFPIQKILFGSPGTGKSYKVAGRDSEGNFVEGSIAKKLGITDPKNIIKTVFHPEYTYGDFIGKLLPQTTGNSVIYKYYTGHFLKALGKAYKNIIDGNKEPVLLVIDELNRGNAAAIFGVVFQLLDRNNQGWSEYEVNLSMLEIAGLLEAMDFIVKIDNEVISLKEKGSATLPSASHDFYNKLRQNKEFNEIIIKVIDNLENQSISIPPNLSIVATINTSDESIYYLDSAFKRRWDWEYIEAPHKDISIDKVPKSITNLFIHFPGTPKGFFWIGFVICLNEFIKSQASYIKNIEDKQIGWWFISSTDNQEIELEKIENKLMFYLWDSVFRKDKRPLQAYLQKEIDMIVTYADFIKVTDIFINKVYDDFEGNELLQKLNIIEGIDPEETDFLESFTF